MNDQTRLFEEGPANPFDLQLHHDNLWIVFRPGCLIYERRESVDIMFKLEAFEADLDEDGFLIWRASTEQVLYNDEAVGRIRHCKSINKFDRRKAVRHLPIFPLHLHPEVDRIQREVEHRGRKYLSLCGVHHCFYNGLALVRDGS